MCCRKMEEEVMNDYFHTLQLLVNQQEILFYFCMRQTETHFAANPWSTLKKSEMCRISFCTVLYLPSEREKWRFCGLMPIFFNLFVNQLRSQSTYIVYIYYTEYHSVCPLVGIGTPPTPVPQASPNSDDWRKSLAVCLLCGWDISLLLLRRGVTPEGSRDRKRTRDCWV